MSRVAVVAPTVGARVRGTEDVRIRVTGGSTVEDVVLTIGDPAGGARSATPTGDQEYVVRWDTTRRGDSDEDGDRSDDGGTPGDALFWLTASAVVDGVVVRSRPVPVLTANDPPDPERVPSGGWRPALAWAADYSGSTDRWLASNSAVVGGRYASVEDDPVLGPVRRAVRVSVPDSAQDDDDQPTSTTVRFQSSSVQNIREGDEFCVGFSFLPDADFPTSYPDGDVTNPGHRPTGWIALFQFYGPPYDDGAPLLLHASRSTVDVPVDEFKLAGNALNPEGPVPVLSLPYRRGHWTDVVLRIRASAWVGSGWLEVYANQGESTRVRPMPMYGLQRIPRVLLRENSGDFRTDMQIYRINDRFDRVTVWHTGHRIARTVDEADPRTYRERDEW